MNDVEIISLIQKIYEVTMTTAADVASLKTIVENNISVTNHQQEQIDALIKDVAFLKNKDAQTALALWQKIASLLLTALVGGIISAVVFYLKR